jgi:hypothetical protein
MSQVFVCIPFTMVSILLALDSTMRFLLCCLLEQILHISDVEVKDTKLLGNSPIIIVAVSTCIQHLPVADCFFTLNTLEM